MDKENFKGKGNAKATVKWIADEFPPLTWNIVVVKLLKSLLAKKINPGKIDWGTEFDEGLLKEIDAVLKQQYGKGLPIY